MSDMCEYCGKDDCKCGPDCECKKSGKKFELPKDVDNGDESP